MGGGIFQPDAMRGRKRYGLQGTDVGQFTTHGHHRLHALTVGEFVGFGQQGQHRHAGRCDPVGQSSVEFGDTAPDVDEHDDAGQRRTLAQIASQDIGPFFPGFLGNSGIAIAGQVDKKAQVCAGLQGVGNTEQVDQTRAAWCFTGKCQPALVGEHVDGG